MNLASMQYFITLSRVRSFTRAAEQLHITQQSLSAAIARLEQELGSALLVRSVPLELTYAGEVFLNYAMDFRRKLDAMEQEFSDLAGDRSGLLRVGIASTRGRAILPPLLSAFQTDYPGVSLRIVEGPNDVLHQYLTDREIDLAIASFPNRIPGIQLEDVYREEVVLLARRDLLERELGDQLPAAIQAAERGDLSPLARCPFLLNGARDIAGRIGRSLLTQSGVVPRVRVEAGNVETLLELCVLGMGLCFCPENLARATLAPAEWEPLCLLRLPGEASYPVRFGYRRQEKPGRLLETFLAAARRMWA